MSTTPALAATPWTATTATLAGDGANQDYAVITNKAAAVLDGATVWPETINERDGGWYARVLGTALRARLDNTGRTLTDHVCDAISEVRDRYELTPADSPSSTVAIARHNTPNIEVFVLGDSPVVVFPATGPPIVISDDRIEHVATTQRAAYLEHLQAGNG